MTNMAIITFQILDLKYKLGQIDPKINDWLNLYENLLAIQFEDSEYKMV